jgi:hypothetical protein
MSKVEQVAPRPSQNRPTTYVSAAELKAQQRAAAQRQADSLTAGIEQRLQWMRSFISLPLSAAPDGSAGRFKRPFVAAGFRVIRPSAPVIPTEWVTRPDLPKLKQARSQRVATKYRARLSAALLALDAHEQASQATAANEEARITLLRSDVAAYADEMARAQAALSAVNDGLDALERAYRAGDPWATESLLRLLAAQLTWPAGGSFPAVVTAFDGTTRTLVAEMNLPRDDWVPQERSYAVGNGNVLAPRPFPPAEAQAVTENFCGAWAIRAARELFRLDGQGHVHRVIINGRQVQFNPATGRDEDRQVLVLDLDRQATAQLDFARLDAAHCVRAHGDLGLDRIVQRRGPLRTAGVEQPAPTRPIRHNHDGEILAAEYMRWLGFADAHELPIGPDGGIDVRASDAIAQVKMHATQVGRPDIQRLLGAAQAEGRKCALFFSQQGYGIQAREFADHVGMPLFTFGYQDGVEPTNDAAYRLIADRRERVGAANATSPYAWLEAELRRTPPTAAAVHDVAPDPEVLLSQVNAQLAAELAWTEDTRKAVQACLNGINAQWPEITQLPPPPEAGTAGPLAGATPSYPPPAESPPPPPTTPAQWSPDPYGRYDLRYFDGFRWTEHVSTQGVAAVDPV